MPRFLLISQQTDGGHRVSLEIVHYNWQNKNNFAYVILALPYGAPFSCVVFCQLEKIQLKDAGFFVLQERSVPCLLCTR